MFNSSILSFFNGTIEYYIKNFVTSMLISKHLYKEENPSIMIIVNRMDTYLRDIISFSTYDIFSMSGKRDTSVGVFYEFAFWVVCAQLGRMNDKCKLPVRTRRKNLAYHCFTYTSLLKTIQESFVHTFWDLVQAVKHKWLRSCILKGWEHRNIHFAMTRK